MCKKVLFTAMVVLAAAFAKADFLYWQVTDSARYSVARLYASDGSTNTKLKTVLPADHNDATLTDTDTGALWTDISSYQDSKYSFFVEMVTYADAEGASVMSQKNGYTWSYDELLSNGYVVAGGIGVPTFAGVGPVNMGSAVPEPTSGLLLMVGGALLALRRRRRA